jgi:hypothetical protein
MQKSQKEKTVQAWDRRPWPVQGDSDDKALYCHVGRFLSFWERYEAALAFLFASFLGQYPTSEPARRAYFSVRTFQGRCEMLKAASTTYFDIRPDKSLQDRVKEVISYSSEFSSRRNDISHGFVDLFQTEDEWKRYGWMDGIATFALYPSIASFKERDTFSVPSYCMTGGEIDYFYGQILKLQPKAANLASDIIKHGRSTSFGKPPPPAP